MASRLPFVRFDRIQHLSCCYLLLSSRLFCRALDACAQALPPPHETALCRSLPLVQKKGLSFPLSLRLELAGVSFASHRLTTPAFRLQHAGGDANRRDSLSTRLALFIFPSFGRDEASWAKTSDAKLVPQAYAKAYTSSAAKKPIPVID